MHLTPIDTPEAVLPPHLFEKFKGAKVYDSSCSPEARVYFIDKDGGYFLKKTSLSLEKEAVMSRYFHSLGLSAEVVYYSAGETELLVTKKVRGSDLTSQIYLDEPKRMAALMGEHLRALHEREAASCPIKHRTQDYLSTFAEGYRIKRFDPSYIDKRLGLSDMESAIRYVEAGKSTLEENVLLHGDFCLPNIIFDDFRLSGYIDLGGAGIGDRHIDLFWGAWTLNFNLHTEKYRDTFFDAYGRDKIDEERLLLVSAIEAFG